MVDAEEWVRGCSSSEFHSPKHARSLPEMLKGRVGSKNRADDGATTQHPRGRTWPPRPVCAPPCNSLSHGGAVDATPGDARLCADARGPLTGLLFVKRP
eukprot:3135075-Prymnesium_polylepis.1